jgi:hypothetical protein
MKKLGFSFLLLAVALMLGGTALAQGDNSVYFTTYYSNASGNYCPPGQTNCTGPTAADATVRIINDGDTGKNLWASIYVFDDSEELIECCSCGVTPDGLLSESVNNNLTANPLTGRTSARGVIKVISSSTESDVNTNFAPNTPTAGLRAWATHIQKYATAVGVTETRFANSNLVKGEQTLLEQLCYFENLLSGYPCTCTPEDHDF